jgi:hypothetical protein
MGKKSPAKKSQDVSRKYLCPYCDKDKNKTEFYTSSDPLVLTGITTMCKECAEKIARNWNYELRQYGDCTKFSIQAALERLDKPWKEEVYEASIKEVNNPNSEKRKSNVWAAYIKNISMPQYRNLRWRDGDIYAINKENIDSSSSQEDEVAVSIVAKSQELVEEYQKNKDSVIRLLGYDPFEIEAEADKPLLYSQLVGYLDMSGDNDDMMRTSSAITIVRGFLQQSKIDDMLAKAMMNINKEGKVGEIKSLLDAKQRIGKTITDLAEQSCLSLKHSKNASKGENTWTGKIKKLKELSLREAEVNGFDLGTCRGMQQVLEMSDSSIMRQLRLDESEWSDMVADQRQMLVAMQNERDIYKEVNRILLRENLDLRDTLENHNLLDVNNLQNLKELFSAFGDIEPQSEEDDEDE